MSLENLKDALDHGLCLSEVEDKFKCEYEDYLLDQLVFFIGVLRQEGEDFPTRMTVNRIIRLITDTNYVGVKDRW